MRVQLCLKYPGMEEGKFVSIGFKTTKGAEVYFQKNIGIDQVKSAWLADLRFCFLKWIKQGNERKGNEERN